MRWQIVCDFDGTITRQDVLGAIFNHFAPDEWMAFEREMNAGNIGPRECVARQTALLRASPAAFDALLDAQQLDPGFKDFLAEADRLGLPFTIASSGYDYSIHRILAHHGIANLEVAAPHLEFAPDDRFVWSFPHANPDCAVDNATCKCGVMGRLRGRKTVYIGDGYSDRCPAEAADFVFAKDALIDHCRAEGLKYRAFATFADITPHLALLKGEAPDLFALAAAA